MSARQFLEELWGEQPEGTKILIWHLPTKRSAWFDDCNEAADYAVSLRKDVYVGVGLSPEDYGPTSRCPSDKIHTISGMWADIDYEYGDVHKTPSGSDLTLPPDEEGAHQLIRAVGMEPTMVIHSGHGLQAYWLFKEPWVLETDSDRKLAKQFSRRWQRNLAARAKHFGWRVDSVHDLARLLRVPETINNKIGDDPIDVKLLTSAGARSDDYDSLEMLLIEEEDLNESRGDVVVEAEGESKSWEYWQDTLGGVDKNDRNNRMTSLAGYYFKSMLIDIDDQKGARMILHNLLDTNQKNRPPLPEDEVRSLWESIWRTENARRASEKAVTDFSDVNIEILGEEGAAEEKLSRVRTALGDLPVARIIKVGRRKADFTFILDDGTAIVAGDIMDQARVRKAVLYHTTGAEIIVPRVKTAVWDSICANISNISEETVLPEEDRSVSSGELVSHYLYGGSAGDVIGDNETWQTSALVAGPFVKNGKLHIHANTMYKGLMFEYIGLTCDEVRRCLIAAGYEPQQVQVKNDNGNTIKRNYLCCPIDDIASTPSPPVKMGPGGPVSGTT